MALDALKETPHALPAFNTLSPETILPALRELLKTQRARIQALLTVAEHNWESLVQPLEEMSAELSHFWSPVSHLHAVKQTPAWREAYQACLPELTAFYTEMQQNKSLYDAYAWIADTPSLQDATEDKQTVVNHALRDFKLAGVDQSPDVRQRLADIEQKLAEQQTTFNNHLLDVTDAWSYTVPTADALAGVPEISQQAAATRAKERQQSGYCLTLHDDCFRAVMQYADDRELRKQMHYAYCTRASDIGPHAKECNNAPIMERILALRLEKAQCLGFSDYADYSLAAKMAENKQAVLSFLDNLAECARPQAEQEYQALCDFAKTQGIDTLEAWDIAYYSERLKQQQFDFSDKDVRPYFPADKVLNGLFSIIKQLFGLSAEDRTASVDTWHDSVRFFTFVDAHNTIRGQIYCDLFARPQKRGGAWMDECRIRLHWSDGSVQTPTAYLNCNFTPPAKDQASLLTHDEVVTLFHECGHCLHHIFTTMKYPSVSGINGVPWDAVEFPSQLLEHWAWQPEALTLFSHHVDSGSPLPETLFKKMLAAKNFQSAMQMLRQLEFALFDFELHSQTTAPTAARIQQQLNAIRERVSVVPQPDYNRFQHGFSHIFGGGYAAGYYSYKWAEVLACDAYALFDEQPFLSTDIPQHFLHTILEAGGSADPNILFKRFRGRTPILEPLLHYSGIKTSDSRANLSAMRDS